MKGQLRLSGGRILQSPKGMSTRPTSSRVREAVMNIIGEKIQGCNWLDLCSGSGIMSCEALERGAKKVLAVEKNRKAAQVCKSNLMAIASDQQISTCIEVLSHEVLSLLGRGFPQFNGNNSEENCFDLVYFDPPYESTMHIGVLEKLLEGNWLKEDSLVICEHSSSMHIKAPKPWIEQDRRIYGSSAISLVTPQQSRFADIDSKQQ